MTAAESGGITLDEFQVLVRRAGLDLDRAEMEHLLPIYRQFAEQVAMLHHADLPLDPPAFTFRAGEGA